jgi:hypothetical protein
MYQIKVFMSISTHQHLILIYNLLQVVVIYSVGTTTSNADYKTYLTTGGKTNALQVDGNSLFNGVMNVSGSMNVTGLTQIYASGATGAINNRTASFIALGGTGAKLTIKNNLGNIAFYLFRF